jgi:hypothetical protein
MTADSGSERSGRSAGAARRRSNGGFSHWLQDRALASDLYLVPALGMVAVGFGIISLAFPDAWPPSMLTLPILAGGLMMKLRGQLLLLLICSCILVILSLNHESYGTRNGSVIAVGATAALVMLTSRSRLRLGVQGTRGEAMLFDLRERLRAQGRVPKLPSDWHVDMSIRSAGGQSFAGDFLIAALGRRGVLEGGEFGGSAGTVGGSGGTGGGAGGGYAGGGGGGYAGGGGGAVTAIRTGTTLELGLVDVSGKGLNAGTRALLLSGAFGGLLGTVPSRDFLSAANKYLLRQDWEEGFATAVHLVIELETGQYRFHSAGHPPIARLTAKTGRWSIEEAEGPLLGVISDSEFPATEGCLDRGDALLLFTDGLVERPGRDLEVGIDRLLGAAETQLTGGFEGGADRLISEVAHDVRDDRALVVVWRT